MSDIRARHATEKEIAYLREASSMLRLPTSTWATGVVLFHRYCEFTYQQNTIEPLNTHICLILCLYLATKVTEEPRKQQDMINVGYKLAHPTIETHPVGDHLEALRNTMTKSELVLMRILGFDMYVELPHVWISYIFHGMGWCKNSGIPSNNTEDLDPHVKRIADTAYTTANKVVEAALVDYTSARVIAAACIVIAMDIHRERLPARNLDEWAYVWAKASGSYVKDIRRLIEDRADLTNLYDNVEPVPSCQAE
ncbi:hypothetical protein H4R20_003611 [Coemansia guatemalensis]|uniref:Cyclin N-terminal domain-containing protein n=1 Tax=Coemansia guatemalensis TaxID=2761395 RepID=A0A9W8LR87_9FUNG|nr:hypothetical protein H4R20_003611 [Coemansia guatemalensis]